MNERLVLSIAEAAEALGLSDDLVYELTERHELPCLHFGRRKVISRRAIDLVIEAALEGFDANVVAADSPGPNATLQRPPPPMSARLTRPRRV